MHWTDSQSLLQPFIPFYIQYDMKDLHHRQSDPKSDRDNSNLPTT